jgi:hypothetical protein
MKEELSGTGFVLFGDCMNILQVSKVKVVDTPIVDTRLVLNWTPSSTKCSTSHWLPQSALNYHLVTFETLCWNWKHVLSNLGSLTGCYSRFLSCQTRVAVSFGCAYLRPSAQNPDSRLIRTKVHPPYVLSAKFNRCGSAIVPLGSFSETWKLNPSSNPTAEHETRPSTGSAFKSHTSVCQ